MDGEGKGEFPPLSTPDDAADTPANRARADRIARQAADAGDANALRQLVVRLIETTGSPQARQLLTCGLEPDGTPTAPWLQWEVLLGREFTVERPISQAMKAFLQRREVDPARWVGKAG
ncbi:hypothetical protein [Kitasatospora sp. MAP5-34]|uniref:hypothetical protein n=1 Tax=Kitasatospora sp. MAP5-34 TaxID=3035102 RepID=UPI0024741D42|nr:hypothetical protein [Kitasatospora sp. MAP5-34]MDH6578227.1 hypothetical protein [Kitasatospora sp. MAP5-34]